MRLDEPACQERTGDKKHERHGELSDDERVAQSESALGRIVDPNALTFERGDQVRPRSAERGNETEENRCRERDEKSEGHDRRVKLISKLDGDRQGRLRGGKNPRGPVGKGNAHNTAKSREHEAFRHQLADEPAPARSNRKTHRNLATTVRRPR